MYLIQNGVRQLPSFATQSERETKVTRMNQRKKRKPKMQKTGRSKGRSKGRSSFDLALEDGRTKSGMGKVKKVDSL